MSKNTNLNKAKENKDNEFYTQLDDIEKELIHYEESFKNKIVYCNCDDPSWSNFVRYFEDNYDRLQLKGLLVSYLKPDGTGDFRSDESIELLKQADIVVTNPPFSLARAYIAQLVEYDKKFIILGSLNFITYKDTFPLFKDNKMWVGCSIHSGGTVFIMPSGELKELGNIRWFTNVKTNRVYDDLVLTKTYNPIDYPKYDNFDAINVDKVKDIPCDYYNAMGVPVTFMDKHDPHAFDVVDGIGRYSMLTGPTVETQGTYLTKIDGIPKYARIIIKRVPQFEILRCSAYSDINNYGCGALYEGGDKKYSRLLIKRIPQFEIVTFRKGNDGKDLCIDGKCVYTRVIIKRIQP